MVWRDVGQTTVRQWFGQRIVSEWIEEDSFRSWTMIRERYGQIIVRQWLDNG